MLSLFQALTLLVSWLIWGSNTRLTQSLPCTVMAIINFSAVWLLAMALHYKEVLAAQDHMPITAAIDAASQNIAQWAAITYAHPWSLIFLDFLCAITLVISMLPLWRQETVNIRFIELEFVLRNSLLAARIAFYGAIETVKAPLLKLEVFIFRQSLLAMRMVGCGAIALASSLRALSTSVETQHSTAACPVTACLSPLGAMVKVTPAASSAAPQGPRRKPAVLRQLPSKSGTSASDAAIQSATGFTRSSAPDMQSSGTPRVSARRDILAQSTDGKTRLASRSSVRTLPSRPLSCLVESLPPPSPKTEPSAEVGNGPLAIAATPAEQRTSKTLNRAEHSADDKTRLASISSVRTLPFRGVERPLCRPAEILASGSPTAGLSVKVNNGPLTIAARPPEQRPKKSRAGRSPASVFLPHRKSAPLASTAPTVPPEVSKYVSSKAEQSAVPNNGVTGVLKKAMSAKHPASGESAAEAKTSQHEPSAPRKGVTEVRSGSKAPPATGNCQSGQYESVFMNSSE